MQRKSKLVAAICAIGACFSGLIHAQTTQTGATFGTVVQLGATPSDIVLDESRQRLYLVNNAGNRVDIYDYAAQSLLGSVTVGTAPLGAAMSMDNSFLYVANHDSSSISIINLNNSPLQASSVSLPAKPQGIEVGFDGRVVICTEGSGTNSANNILLIYDPAQVAGAQVQAVVFPPTAPTPSSLATNVVRITTNFNGRLQRTPDGKFIYGVNQTTNNTSTVAYVYEVASGTILRNRTVTGQATTLAIAPDAASFMAGFTLYDSSTLNVIGQQSNANAPFALTAFTVNGNFGGSVFSPDGSTLYSAFSSTAGTTSANTLLISDPRSLAIKLGINLPEGVISKIVMSSDGANAWALSASGILYLPLSTLYNYPILMPESTVVFLAQDDCNPGIAQAGLRINNIGGGKLTFSVPGNVGAAMAVVATTGVAPSTVNFTMDPGRSGVIRTPGTNLYTGGGNANGTPITVTLTSADAINVIPQIRVYMNYRDASQRGSVYPIQTVPSAAEGLYDILFDSFRSKVYITNSGYNRIEVFDAAKQQFQAPIPVGQLPHQMIMSSDGSTLYVSTTGGEGIQVLDLDQQLVTGTIRFPAIPRAGNAAPVFVRAMANSASGLQMVLSNGNLYKVSGNDALPRTGTTVTGVATTGAQTPIPAPQTFLGADDGSSAILLGGNGTAYLFDGINDAYTTSRALFPTNNLIGYYGPLGVAPNGNFLLANGLVTNRSLTPIGGATAPGQINTVITPPAPGGGFPGVTQTLSSTGLRNIAAVIPIDKNFYMRMSTAVRTNLTTTTNDDVHTILEAVDTRNGASAIVAEMPDNPVISQFTTPPRNNIAPRQLAVDTATGTVYAITLSGLSVVSMAPTSAATAPVIASTRGVVNTDGTNNFKPGSFIRITGTNLAQNATADNLPAPTVLGGSCVLVGGVAVPLITTSPSSIQAQIPTNLRTGTAVVQVRSLTNAQRSAATTITVQKP